MSLRLAVVLGFAVAFAAGFAGGWFASSRPQQAREKTYLQDLETTYDLRPDQVERVKEVLDDEERAIRSVLEATDDRVRDDIRRARAATTDRIRGVLDETQRTRFDRDLAAAAVPTGGADREDG